MDSQAVQARMREIYLDYEDKETTIAAQKVELDRLREENKRLRINLRKLQQSLQSMIDETATGNVPALPPISQVPTAMLTPVPAFDPTYEPSLLAQPATNGTKERNPLADSFVL